MLPICDRTVTTMFCEIQELKCNCTHNTSHRVAENPILVVDRCELMRESASEVLLPSEHHSSERFSHTLFSFADIRAPV